MRKLKRPYNWLLTLPVFCIGLWGCPYSSPFALDESPGINIQDELIGKWAVSVQKPRSQKTEPVKMILWKKNDTEYYISFTGYLDEMRPFHVIQNDSINGNAFISTAAGKQFMNITIHSRIYLAELIFDHGSLSLLPLSEHFTSRIVQSNTSLRNCIEFHYKTRRQPLYDEEFCLRGMARVN